MGDMTTGGTPAPWPLPVMFPLAVLYMMVLVGMVAHLLPAAPSDRWRPWHGWAIGFPLGCPLSPSR
jgi:hypothetical protein